MYRKSDLPEKVDCDYCKKEFNTDDLCENRLRFEQLICDKCNNGLHDYMSKPENREKFEDDMINFLSKPIIKKILNN